MSLLDTASLVITPNGTKAGTLYSVVPSSGAGDMTVTRATTATRVNSAGLIESVASNVPRLDYSNGTCPSILVEPQRTNVVTYSEQFDNSFWVKGLATVTANDTTSPSGILNADKVSFNNGTINSTVTVSANTTYTISFFAKKGTANTFRIAEAYWVGTYVEFDLNTGTVTDGTGKIEDYGNGWYRCSMQFTYGVGQTIASWVIRNYEAGYIYVWGAQLEAGSYATSYIPTTSASVTRNADVISKTGISSLIGQTEGTLFVDFNYTQNSGSSIVSIFNTAVSNSIFFETFNNILYLTIITSGALVCQIPFTTLTNQNYKIAVGYKLNNIVFYVNGSQVGVDTSATIPATNEINLGFLGASFTQQKTNINSVALWKTRLTNTQLAQLTTI
jgi:hypothetical protein